MEKGLRRKFHALFVASFHPPIKDKISLLGLWPLNNDILHSQVSVFAVVALWPVDDLQDVVGVLLVVGIGKHVLDGVVHVVVLGP